MKLGRRTAATARLIVLAGVLGVAGCTGEAEVAPPTPSPSEYESDYEAPAPAALAPLTGVRIAAGALDAPSIAAKIDNHPAARPQVGLESADIVFEELVEGGMTRYLAIWHSAVPETLGPVRSIRPMDPDIASPFGGIIAYSGGQQRFVDLMRNTPVYNAIHGQPDTNATFYRAPDRQAPHNVLVRAREVVAQHGDLAAPPQQFAYAADAATATAVTEGSPVASIQLRFGALSSPSWTWDGNAGYLRAQAGAADLDTSGAQLGAVNVIVVRVPISHDLGVPKTELIGSGEAWVSTGGSTVHATWSKQAATDRIRLVADTGAVVRLAPGNTWVELVPVDGSAEFTAP